jgi:hypothetical protein
LDQVSEFLKARRNVGRLGIWSAVVGIAAGDDSPLDSHERTSRKEETTFAAPRLDVTDAGEAVVRTSPNNFFQQAALCLPGNRERTPGPTVAIR